MAHAGYLQADKTLFMCVCSSSSWSWLEQISFALCNSELITLYLLDMAWWLSHCKYWLVWVGFLYTLVDRLPSLLVLLKFPERVWIHQLWWFQLWILSSLQWHWCDWKTLLCVLFPKWQKCHPQISSIDLGGCCAVSRAFVSKFFMKILATMGLSGDPIAAPSTCS